MSSITSPELFFHLMRESFDKAENSSDNPCAFFYSIGGAIIKLAFANQALVQGIIPALEHLTVAKTNTPALTIYLFDSVSTGVAIPSRPWDDDDCLALGKINGFNNSRMHTSFDVGSSILNLLDVDTNTAVFWTKDASQLPYWETGSPLRIILHWWLRQKVGQFLHAGAVGFKQGGVVLAGKSGSGKSTTSLLCLQAGLHYVADDYCLLSSKPSPYVHSLYNSGKVGATDLARFPAFSEALYNHSRLQQEKALFFFNRYFADRISPGFPLKAIIIPKIMRGQEETVLTLASPMHALKALAPSTIFQLAGAGHYAFHTIAEVAKQLPCYSLQLGANLANIPRVIVDLLQELGCYE